MKRTKLEIFCGWMVLGQPHTPSQQVQLYTCAVYIPGPSTGVYDIWVYFFLPFGKGAQVSVGCRQKHSKSPFHVINSRFHWFGRGCQISGGQKSPFQHLDIALNGIRLRLYGIRLIIGYTVYTVIDPLMHKESQKPTQHMMGHRQANKEGHPPTCWFLERAAL